MRLSGGHWLSMRFRLPWDTERAGNQCPPYENRNDTALPTPLCITPVAPSHFYFNLLEKHHADTLNRRCRLFHENGTWRGITKGGAPCAYCWLKTTA